MALSILIGGLLLDVLISIVLGVSALPVNIIIGTYFIPIWHLLYLQIQSSSVPSFWSALNFKCIGTGVIVVLGLGTALRLALEFCHEWSLRRVTQRIDTNVNVGYYPAL